MSRYFFDLKNSDGLMRDEHGAELASREHVPREIKRLLLDVANDELPNDHATISVVVRDESGKPISIATLSFRNEWLD
ncbi:DUF6894 family protein [Rhizobium binxianense]